MLLRSSRCGIERIAKVLRTVALVDHATLNQMARRNVRGHHPVKAHIETLPGWWLLEGLDVLVVLRRRGPQAQRRPIAQNHVADQGLRAHTHRLERKSVSAQRSGRLFPA